MANFGGLLDEETLAQLQAFNQPSEEAQAQARRNALMQAGFSMMANNRGLSKGQAFGNALGHGGMAGMDAYQGTMDAAQKNQMNQLTQGLALSKFAEARKEKQLEEQKRIEQQKLVEELAAKNPQFAELLKLDYKEAFKQIYPAPNKVDPYYTPLPTADGYASFDNRKGTITPLQLNGSPAVRATDSPIVQGNIARAKETGKIEGEQETTARYELPKHIAQAEQNIKLIDELVAHPGFEMAVGKSSMLGVHKIPGTDAYDFMNRLGQVRGGSFLDVFQQLKGAGQITEIEGEKGTQAINRMNNASSESEFKSAAADLRGIIVSGVERAKAKAQPSMPETVRYPSSAGTQGGARVPNGNESRNAILSNEMAAEQQRLATARQNGDLKGISEANRNIQLLQKEMGVKVSAQPEVAKVRRYNPQTGRIE